MNTIFIFVLNKQNETFQDCFKVYKINFLDLINKYNTRNGRNYTRRYKIDSKNREEKIFNQTIEINIDKETILEEIKTIGKHKKNFATPIMINKI